MEQKNLYLHDTFPPERHQGAQLARHESQLRGYLTGELGRGSLGRLELLQYLIKHDLDFLIWAWLAYVHLGSWNELFFQQRL